MSSKEDSSNSNNPTKTLSDLVEDGKNKYSLLCVRCPSKILNASVAEFKELHYPLPAMMLRKDKSEEAAENETLSEYWLVTDKFSFENIGVSNAVSGVKYLTCADCEIGPIGWFDSVSQQSYVSVNRVKYET